MYKKAVVIGIIFLFLVTAVTPLSIGNHIATSHDETYSKFLDDLLFYASSDNPYINQSIIQSKYLHYMKYSDDHVTSRDGVTLEEMFSTRSHYKTKQQSSQSRSSGPMDSAWSMFGQNIRHTAQSPYGTEGNPGTEKWRFLEDRWIEECPVIDNDGIIYISDAWGDVLSIFSNGSMKWKFTTDGQIMGSSPAIDEDGTIYVGSWDYRLYAINPNGTLKWRINTHDAIIATSPALADDGTIYIGTLWSLGDGGKIFAINPDGTKKWYYKTGGGIFSNPAIGEDGTIYIGSEDSYLYALYPNGTLRWRFKTGDEIHGHPSIAEDGTIYIGSFDDYFYAINPDGTMKWKFPTSWGTSACGSIGIDGIIYVGTNKLRAINPNGTLKWSFDLGSDRWIGKSSPAISADGTIYVGTHVKEMSGGEIIAVNSDGTEKWRSDFIANDWIESSPSIDEDGTVYIGSSSDTVGYGKGCLHAFNYFELEADANGPYIGIINEPVQFTGSAGGGYPPYSWEWNFGDEIISYEQNPTHMYIHSGNYTVTLTVTDDKGNTTSDTTWANIRESNSPPNSPAIDGPTEGKAGESYDYTFTTTDPNDDNIHLYIEWGDGETEEWIGPYNSGNEVTLSHTWDEEGTYEIKAKAKDIFDEESDWATLEVTMPRNKPVMGLFESRFPLLFRLLNIFNTIL